MAPNNHYSVLKVIVNLSSIGGLIVGSVLIGMYIDDKFFNHSGTAVIVCTLIGILSAIANIVKLVILTREPKKN